jgi:hypothetical protein
LTALDARGTSNPDNQLYECLLRLRFQVRVVPETRGDTGNHPKAGLVTVDLPVVNCHDVHFQLRCNVTLTQAKFEALRVNVVPDGLQSVRIGQRRGAPAALLVIRSRIAPARHRQSAATRNAFPAPVDQIDIHLEVPRIEYEKLADRRPGETSARVRDRVAEARERQLQLSARAYHRVLKLARTIADLSGEDHIQTPHLAEALQYRPRE